MGEPVRDLSPFLLSTICKQQLACSSILVVGLLSELFPLNGLSFTPDGMLFDLLELSLSPSLLSVESTGLFLFSAAIDEGVTMVNLVYRTGGWVARLPELLASALADNGDAELMLDGELEELCVPMRMFSTVKLETSLGGCCFLCISEEQTGLCCSFSPPPSSLSPRQAYLCISVRCASLEDLDCSSTDAELLPSLSRQSNLLAM